MALWLASMAAERYAVTYFMVVLELAGNRLVSEGLLPMVTTKS